MGPTAWFYEVYIREQVERARQGGAPANAVHRNEDGTWMTTDNITSSNTRRQMGLDPLPPGPPELAIIAEELQGAVLWSPWLRDTFGLRDVELVTDHLLSIRFATGYIVELQLRLQVPSEPG